MAPLLGMGLKNMLGGTAKRPLPTIADPEGVQLLTGRPSLEGAFADLAEGRGIDLQDPGMAGQRELAGWQQQDLDALLARAQGQDLLSTQQGLEQQRALQAAAMGQAASARGAYNPALRAAAAREASMMPAQMAAGLRANEEAERMAALQAYNQNVAGMRQQDQTAMNTWMARQGMERQRQLQQEQRRQAMLALQQRADLGDVNARARLESLRTGMRAQGWSDLFGEEAPHRWEEKSVPVNYAGEQPVGADPLMTERMQREGKWGEHGFDTPERTKELGF
jgi:hypothetical protein